MEIKLSRFFASYYARLLAKKPIQQRSNSKKPNSKIIKVSESIGTEETAPKKILPIKPL